MLTGPKLSGSIATHRITVSSMNRNYLHKFSGQKTKTYAIALVVILVVIFALVKFNPFQGSSSSASSNSKTAIKDPISTLTLNKEFKFPLKDEKSETVGEIKYIIESAEIRDEIIIKGKKAYAVDGKAFLVFNLKIVNDSNKNISMATKDYVRLIVNGNENEPLSPSIHNDPVVVDAISVKPTRIGFSIDKSDKDLKIKVGEIKGEKTTLDIKF